MLQTDGSSCHLIEFYEANSNATYTVGAKDLWASESHPIAEIEETKKKTLHNHIKYLL